MKTSKIDKNKTQAQNKRNSEDNSLQGKEEQKTKKGDKEKSYSQGMDDNDNRNSDVPDIGREDAERTSRETPRM